MMSTFDPRAADFFLRLLLAAVVLGAGIAVAHLLRKILYKREERFRLGGLARQPSILPWLAHSTTILVTALVVLSVLGVPFTIIGTFVTVGIALGFVADIYSGVRISASQLFQVGDLLEIQGEKVIGTVTMISLSTTVLTTEHGVNVIVPNRKLTERMLLNHSVSGGKLVAFRMELASFVEIEEVESEIKRIAGTVTEEIIGEVKCSVVKIDDATLTFVIAFRVRYLSADRLESAFLKAVLRELRAKEMDIRVLTVENASDI